VYRLRSEFRVDLNGLRACAVLLVVCFHFGIPPFSGGFVGVDVFFVISGFLMTRILADQDKIDVFGFYIRRILRILPALTITILTTISITAILLLPGQFIVAAREAVYSELFVVNIYYAVNTGYFDPQAAQSWFLHCWSLAVEFQFYIFFPFYLIASRRISPKQGTVIGFLLILVLSLSFAVFQTTANQLDAFFLPFSRIWEFVAGGLVERLQGPIRYRSALAFCGLLMIAVSAVGFNEHMAYPGAWPLVPVTGAALVLWAESDLPLLRNRLLQTLGTNSYSIYLWHWPALLTARYLGLMGGAMGIVGLSIITFAISTVSYDSIEKPFRKTGGRVVPLLGAALAAFVVVWVYLSVRDGGAPWRVPERVQAIMQNSDFPKNDWRYHACFLDPDEAVQIFKKDCFDKPSGRSILFVWGDSTAAALYPGIAHSKWAQNYQIDQATSSSCSVWSLTADAALPNCHDIREYSREFVLRQKPEVIVLSTARNSYGPGVIENLARQEGLELGGLIEALRTSGVKKIIVVGPPPAWDRPLPELFYREVFRSGKMPDRLSPPDFQNIRRWDRSMRAFVEKSGGVYISIIDSLCDETSCNVLIPSSTVPSLIQFDDLHLTRNCSDWVAATLIGPVLGGK
jgi:peptidoglycan/LPS O-acetylase OafA/YrhL